MGRRTKLTPELVQQFHQILGNKNTIKTACDALDVDDATYFRWVQKGEAQAKGIYRDFRDAVTRARAITKVQLVQELTKHAALDWRAAAWLLERSFRDEYGPPARLEITGKDGKEILPPPPAGSPMFQVNVTIAPPPTPPAEETKP